MRRLVRYNTPDELARWNGVCLFPGYCEVLLGVERVNDVRGVLVCRFDSFGRNVKGGLPCGLSITQLRQRERMRLVLDMLLAGLLRNGDLGKDLLDRHAGLLNRTALARAQVVSSLWHRCRW